MAHPCKTWLLNVAVLAACSDDVAVGSNDASSGGTSGDTGSLPTTGEIPFDPCACDEPVVHAGELEVEDLADYQDVCLAEVTGVVALEALADASQLAVLAHLHRAKSLRINNSPGLVDLAPLACLGDVDSVTLYDNPDLVDIGALAGLERAGSLNLHDMPIATLPEFSAGYQGFHTLGLTGLLDAAADIEEAKQDGLEGAEEGRPKVLLTTPRDYLQWIGAGEEEAALFAVGQTTGTVKLDIQGRLGNWTELDPGDPPRLFGQITTTDPNAALTLEGPFEAAFCESFVERIPID